MNLHFIWDIMDKGYVHYILFEFVSNLNAKVKLIDHLHMLPNLT